jgi:hypothetical protein
MIDATSSVANRSEVVCPRNKPTLRLREALFLAMFNLEMTSASSIPTQPATMSSPPGGFESEYWSNFLHRFLRCL